MDDIIFSASNESLLEDSANLMRTKFENEGLYSSKQMKASLVTNPSMPIMALLYVPLPILINMITTYPLMKRV